MSLENIALGSLGAKVLDHSSSSDEHSYPPSNVLSDKEEEIWNSAQGLPQFITISLQEVTVKYTHIGRLGFYCWHDYTTNPKSIEVEVALSEDDKPVLWCRLTLKHQSGRQFFNIQPLPPTYRIIKITITETFGDYETYLNQIYIQAQIDSQLNSMMALNDLESPLRNSRNALSYKRKYLQNYRPKLPYRKEEEEEEEGSQEEEREYVENTFHNKQYSASKQPYSKRQSKYSQQEEEEEEGQQDQSYQNDIALLTLSKNVMEMEENIEEIKRSLQVLNMRIDVTYEKLEEKMMERIEDMVDKKLEKMKHQIKNELKRSTQLRESKSQHERIEHVKSKQLRLADFQQEERQNTASMRENKPSLHIHNLKSNRVEKESSKELIVSDLMDKLAKKLKERELKIKKIESKRERTSDNRSGLHQKPYI